MEGYEWGVGGRGDVSENRMLCAVYTNKPLYAEEVRGRLHAYMYIHTHGTAPPATTYAPATLSSASLLLSSENRPSSIESNVDILEVRTGWNNTRFIHYITTFIRYRSPA